MPRISWSLAAALSMSAIAVFRPEIGSKSFAAQAARSFTRVVASLSQRFHAPSDQVQAPSAETRFPRAVDVEVQRAENAPTASRSGSRGAGQSGASLTSSERRVADIGGDINGVSSGAKGVSHAGSFKSIPAKYSGPSAIYIAALVDAESDVSVGFEPQRVELSPQTHGRQWKDCAVAAICSGIPGPVATLNSTTSRTPPSV